MPVTPRPLQRVLVSVATAGAVVTGGALTAAHDAAPAPNLSSTYDAQARQRAEVGAERRPHAHAAPACLAAQKRPAKLAGCCAARTLERPSSSMSPVQRWPAGHGMLRALSLSA